MGRPTFHFDFSGRWSGGGLAYKSLAQEAASNHAILRGGPGSVPIIPRNVTTRLHLGQPFVLAPQNAWPWRPQEVARSERVWLTKLRAASEVSMRRAAAIHRLGSAIPLLGDPDKYSAPLQNVLDATFEEALKESRSSTLPEAKGAFVSVGGVNSYRNFRRLVQAYRRYRDAGGLKPLVLIGPVNAPDVAAGVEAAAKGLDRIHLLFGRMPRPQVLAALRDADTVVLPSLVETSPFSTLEAACLNPRILPSALLANREALGSFGLTPTTAFFEPTSVGHMASALTDGPGAAAQGWHDVLSDPEARRHARVDWGRRLAAWLESLDTPRTTANLTRSRHA